MSEPLLRLRAEDADDLQVIAAVLQDARVPLRETAYAVDEGRFMAAFCRLRWERLADPRATAQLTEIGSVLTVEAVEAVRLRGIDRDDRDSELSLLTVHAAQRPAGGACVTLLFADGGAVQLDVRRIACRLEDFGDACGCGAPPRSATLVR